MSRLGPQGTTLEAGARLAAQVIAGIGDQVEVVRESRGAINVTTGAYTTAESSVYTGNGRVRRTQPGEVDAGGAAIPVERTTISLPLGTAGVLVGDVVRVTGSRSPELVGREFVVSEVPSFSADTSLVLVVSERTIPVGG
jgi:hypothetical protein